MTAMSSAEWKQAFREGYLRGLTDARHSRCLDLRKSGGKDKRCDRCKRIDKKLKVRSKKAES